MVDELKVVGAGGGGGDIEPDTLFTNSIGKGIYIFSEGPVGGLATGDAKSIYLNDVPLLDSTGSPSAKGVSWTWRSGLPDQQYIDGFPAAVTYQNVGVNVKQGSPYTVTIANGSDNYDAAYVVVSIPQLAFNTKKGNIRKTRVAFQIDVRANGGSWVTQHNIDFVGKSSSEWEGTYRVELPAGGSPWNIRLVRNIEDSDDGPRPNGETYLNETHFARYATITDGKFTYRNSAALGIQFDAKQYGSNIPSVKVLMDGIMCYVPKNYNPNTRTYATTGPGTSGGLWDGTFKAAVTDNPIWIYHDLLVNNRYGLGQDFNPNNEPETAFVDKWSLYSLAQYCDEPVSNGRGGTEPRFTINCQITNKQEAYDLLQNIMSTVNGMLYFSAEQVVAVADRPQSVVDAFTQADVEGGLFEYAGTALKTRHSVCIVNFRDPDNLYKTSNVIYEDPEYIQEVGYRVTEVNAFGCTSRAQATRLAKWTLRTERTQTQTVTFQTGHRGGLLRPGQIIKIFDDYKTGQRTGGRILDVSVVGNEREFLLDAPLSVTTADRLVYLSAEGQLQEVPFPRAYTNTATVRIPDTYPAPINGGMYGVVFASLDGQQFRVLVVEQGDDDKYIVSALQHDPGKFAYVDSNVKIEQPPTSVLSSNALSPIREGNIAISFDELSGTQSLPKAVISWKPPTYASNYPVASKRNQIDDRVSSYELQLATPSDDYMTVYTGDQVTWTSGILELSELTAYSARVRSRDSLGRVSPWYEYESFAIKPNGEQLPPVTNLTANSILNGIALSWDNPDEPSFKHTEIRVAILPVPPEGQEPEIPTDEVELRDLYNVSPVAARVVDDFYILQNVETPNPRLFFFRTISHNPDLPIDDPNYQPPQFVYITGVRGVLNPADVPTPSGTIRFVDELPDLTDYDGPSVVYLKPEGVLYHIVNGQWVQLIADNGVTPVVTLPPTAEEGQIVVKDGKLYVWRNGQWEAIVPDLSELDGGIEVVSTLPATAEDGKVVFLSTDGKLYRRYNGQWITAISAEDITGQLTSNQIAGIVASKISGILATANIPSLDASKINSGTLGYNHVPVLGNDKLAADSVKANNIEAGAVVAGKLGANAVIAGTIAAGVIGTNELAANAVTAAKILAGAIDADKLAANAVTAGKIAAGAVTAGTIAAGAVTTDSLEAGAVTAAKIAANTITGDKIAGTTITGAKIAGDTITAGHLQAGAVTAGKITVTDLASINSNLGNITGGALNIANKFIVDSSGNTTIRSGTTGPRLVLTSTQLQVYDANTIRVRIGLV